MFFYRKRVGVAEALSREISVVLHLDLVTMLELKLCMYFEVRCTIKVLILVR